MAINYVRGGLPILPIPEPSVEAPTPADFRAEFPAFASDTDYPDALITRMGKEALSIHALSEVAHRYCLAHLLVLSKAAVAVQDGGAGEIKSEGIGKKRVGYMTQAETERDVFFSTTSYGRAFLTHERRTPARQMSIRVF